MDSLKCMCMSEKAFLKARKVLFKAPILKNPIFPGFFLKNTLFYDLGIPKDC